MRICKTCGRSRARMPRPGLGPRRTLDTEVSRYQAMPAPQGRDAFTSFRAAAAADGGLEFQRYAGIVAQQLQARGYPPASDARGRDMVVQLGYPSTAATAYGSTRVPVLWPAASVTVGSPFYSARGFGLRLRSALSLGLGRSVLVRPRRRQLCRISQPDRPSHPRRRAPTSRCSIGRAQAASETNRLDVSCRAWSKRCSPASPDTAARR